MDLQAQGTIRTGQNNKRGCSKAGRLGNGLLPAAECKTHPKRKTREKTRVRKEVLACWIISWPFARMPI